ncbi:hypothetical protein PGIGA_G00151760 [Pangasianodon gigas]|uniref:Uncharacterized protein n=1 Tax=Pangasianodon gigas TaxID=30993 RepID=A0ACC5XPE6_PANGG|nr:hypothetical protein [Pangasianodon gigas]
MGYDRHLFILNLNEIDVSRTTVFYQSVLRACSLVFKANRTGNQPCYCVNKEPLFNNPLIPARILTSSVRQRLHKARLTKLRGLRAGEAWKSHTVLSEESHLLQGMLREVILALPPEFREALEQGSGGDWQCFPSISISAAVEQQEEDRKLLSFSTLQLTDIENASKKVLYGVRESDRNGDGKADRLSLQLSVPLNSAEQIYSIQLLLTFSYQLRRMSVVVMQSMVLVQSSSPVPVSQLFISGDLKLQQKEPLSHRGVHTEYNVSGNCSAE